MCEFRVQDIVARVAGVSLKETAKVLSALLIVSKGLSNYEMSNHQDMTNMLEELLADSAIDDRGDFVGLMEKPSTSNKIACDEAYNRLVSINSSLVRGIKYESDVQLRRSINNERHNY